MKKIFELKPILVAAAIGAVMLLVIEVTTDDGSQGTIDYIQAGVGGAVLGTVVQIGVRLTGVS
jgi:hypothetical protein